MQPTSREMQGLPSMGSSQIPQLQDLQNDHSAHDDFFDQMLSTLPSWTDLSQGNNPKSPWDLSSGGGSGGSTFDESVLLASRLRQHQISGGGGGGGGTKTMGLPLNHQQQQMMVSPMARSGDSGLIPLPLSLGSGDSSVLLDRSRDEVDAFKPPNPTGGDGLYNGFGASLQRVAQAAAANAQPFSHPQGATQSYGAPSAGMGQAQSASAASGGTAPASGTAPPRQRVRARRGQATDPHSIAERLRRERIAERMKALQELVPNANKTDKASMLDEIIDYVKFLQLQVKVLSMSRLGGAAAVAPLVADMSLEGPGGGGRANGSNQAGGGGSGSSGNDSLTVTEHQVAKLMEEDMGSAMQYLQGKGLCLMPISLASAISTATGHPRSSSSAGAAAAHLPTGINNNNGSNVLLPHLPHPNNVDGPPSPSMSVLTVQSAMATNGQETDGSRPSNKDNASVSKP